MWLTSSSLQSESEACKTKLADPELRAMDAGNRKAIVDKLLASKIWEASAAKVERPQMVDGETWEGAAYVNLGSYQHGGITSITVATEKFVEEAELAARLLSLDHPGKVFTSIALVKKCNYASTQGLLQSQVHGQPGVAAPGLEGKLCVARDEAGR